MAKISKQNKLGTFRKLSIVFWALYIFILSMFAAVWLFGEGWDKIISLVVVLPMFLVAIPLLLIHVLVEYIAAARRKDTRLKGLYTPLLIFCASHICHRSRWFGYV